MRTSRAVLPLFAAIFLALSGRAPAAPPSFETIHAALAAVHTFSEVAISPDGRNVAFGDTLLHVAAVAAPIRARIVTACAKCAGSAVAWSPDSRSIAFISTDAAGQGNVAIADASGANVRVLTHLHGPAATPRWSPDGRTIALLYSPGAPKAPSPLQPGTPDAGVVGSNYYEQRLAVVPAAGGAVRVLGPADLNVYEYDWSPDGTRFAVSAAHGDGDANWWVAALYTIDARSGATHRFYVPATQMASPRFSGDGSRIAYICGVMSDESVTGGNICVVPVRGGAAVDVTPDLPASVKTIDWRGSRATILATTFARGQTCVVSFAIDARTHRTQWCALQSIFANSVAGITSGDNGISVSRDGRVSAVIKQSLTSPPEIAIGPIGAWRNATSANVHVMRLNGGVHNITWKSDDFTVQGYVIEPLGYRPGKPVPLITVVHGGPSFASEPIYAAGPLAFDAILTARGYAVFQPNPRGSYGNGEAFTRANIKDFGGGDLRDILSGLDAVNAVVPADPKRTGIMGWSYGGYMVMWSLTQTDRFKAAVSGAGLSDWLSYYGTNGIDTWMLPFFGASIYDDPAVYAKSSPMTFIKNVRTPALMVGGTLDDEVPITQSYEYWHALKERHVPTQLVVYPGEGHLFNKPADELDVSRRLVAWFDRWLK